MSRKTLALIITLLVLTIILVVVAIYTQGKQASNTDGQAAQEQASLSTPTPEFAQTTLLLSPNPVYPNNTGSTSATTVNVEIDTGTNEVSAVQLEIQYDPSVLTNMRVTPGDFFPTPNVLPIGGVDQRNGRITYAIGPANIRQSQKGTGTVAVLHFTPRTVAGVTESEITLLESSLVTQLGQAKSVLKERKSTRVVLPLQQRTQQAPAVQPTTASPSGQ